MPRCSTAVRNVPRRAGFIDAYGAALHGYSRGSQAFFPEPLDSWLAVLMDCVPFYQKCMLVCPSSMARGRAALLFRRAQEHLPTVRMCRLRPRVYDNQSDYKGACSHYLQVKGGSLPSLFSPLEEIEPQSLDLVVFAANVFGEEMLHDAPWHLSLAHRSLRSNGVVAIMGYNPSVSVVATEAAKSDTDAFLDHLKQTVQNALEVAQSDKRRVALTRARDVSNSLEVGHTDMYFPFPAVQRRWFVCEHQATPAQLAAVYRCLPIYQILYGESLETAHSYRSKDIEIVPVGMDDNECLNDGAPNILRRRSIVDPLETLEACLRAREVEQGRGLFVSPSLRVQVQHFVVTCSARSINTSSIDTFPCTRSTSPRLK
ncbi:hypothetical protein ERJ75_000772800 [Trypanosoma vivax]|nr:hypothetical protein TRVL_02748 [Trypanosoma vivax]KAH8614218.1 hypothetical protein ERJ75_000772800 [Trypanosoma vivax]